MGVRMTDQGWTECAGLHARLRAEPEAFNAGVELRPGDPEDRCGSPIVALGALQGGENGAPFQMDQRLRRRWLRCVAARAFQTLMPSAVQTEMGRRQEVSLGIPGTPYGTLALEAREGYAGDMARIGRMMAPGPPPSHATGDSAAGDVRWRRGLSGD